MTENTASVGRTLGEALVEAFATPPPTQGPTPEQWMASARGLDALAQAFTDFAATLTSSAATIRASVEAMGHAPADDDAGNQRR